MQVVIVMIYLLIPQEIIIIIEIKIFIIKSIIPQKIKNLKKSNSQKILCDKNNKERKINFSRNSKKIHNNAGNKIINNDKLYKSKSINQRIELSKSFNDDLYGSFSLYSKNNSKNKSCKKNNYKEIKKREILIKKNSENTKKNNILIIIVKIN